MVSVVYRNDASTKMLHGQNLHTDNTQLANQNLQLCHTQDIIF